MKPLNKILAALLVVLMFSSCKSGRHLVQQTSTDNTTVTYSNVEKTVHITGDSVKVKMQVQVARDKRDTGDMGTGEVSFVPQIQQLETKRTKVTIELTKTGEIKATAVSKELDEKVTVQEKTTQTVKNTVTVTEKKENWFKRTFKTIGTAFKALSIIAVILVLLAVWLRFGKIKAFISNLLRN